MSVRKKSARGRGSLELATFNVSPPLAPRVTDAGVDTWVRGMDHASDHAPAWMTISKP